MENKTYRILTIVTVIVLAAGTIFYHIVERWKWLDAFYFSVVTLATVGYGDFVPKTNAGKLFTIFYILIGVGIIATFIHERMGRVAKRIRKKKSKQLLFGNSFSIFCFHA